MNISGMRPRADFYDYNSIKMVALRSQQIAEAKRAGDGGQETQTRPSEQPRPQTYNAFTYAQEYQPNETYELKGRDSDLASLDLQKALSTMEKDQVLQQYQYFAGTPDTEDGGVRKTAETGVPAQRFGEDFSLL